MTCIVFVIWSTSSLIQASKHHHCGKQRQWRSKGGSATVSLSEGKVSSWTDITSSGWRKKVFHQSSCTEQMTRLTSPIRHQIQINILTFCSPHHWHQWESSRFERRPQSVTREVPDTHTTTERPQHWLDSTWDWERLSLTRLFSPIGIHAHSFFSHQILLSFSRLSSFSSVSLSGENEGKKQKTESVRECV